MLTVATHEFTFMYSLPDSPQMHIIGILETFSLINILNTNTKKERERERERGGVRIVLRKFPYKYISSSIVRVRI